jgi:hypothetical protein
MYEISVFTSHKTQNLIHYVEQVVKDFEANIAGFYENIFSTWL